MKKLIVLFLLFSVVSCRKMECVKTAAPELIGDWVHYSENDGFHYIYIEENGKGSMYGVNNHGNNHDTQRRGWFVEDDVLYFSRYSNNASEDKFTIDQYPDVTVNDIHLMYDTIYAGETFMKLNSRYYKKI